MRGYPGSPGCTLPISAAKFLPSPSLSVILHNEVEGNVSESECSTQCASNENCDAYLIDPDNNDCLNFKFNPNNVSTSKCSSWPEGRFYGRIKKNK